MVFRIATVLLNSSDRPDERDLDLQLPALSQRDIEPDRVLPIRVDILL